MEKLSYRMINIGTAPAGLLGLAELFEELYRSGTTSMDEDLDNKLVLGVRKHNFVPKSATPDYAAALRREYSVFFKARQGGKAVVAKDYGQWEGRPRENIPWFPIVSAELCDGCGACIQICPKEVFEKEGSKVIVNEPFLCIVGCCFCKSACKPKAILMPNREMLDSYRHNMK